MGSREWKMRDYMALRHNKIIEMVNERGTVTVQDLCQVFDVSPLTIRRDLAHLESMHLVSRHHGGASRVGPNPITSFGDTFQNKIEQQAGEKMRIGKRAAEFVSDEDIVFMNSGTTVLQFLSALNAGRKLTIVTNNAASTQYPLGENISLMMLGGEFHSQLCSVSGELTVQNLNDIYSSVTVLGVNALDFERGLMTSYYQECGVNNAMINHSRGKVIILADHTKIGKLSHFVSSPLSKVDIVITDDACPPAYVSELENRGIQVVIA